MKSQLLATLKQSFGFPAFRPLQEEIILDALNGLDVFALLPTGGGKSLCFQLPALIKPGLTVVVSPLISLMKDQVDALHAAGIAATFLNSAIAQGEGRKRLRGLHNGEYKLLYAAPERLMLSGMLEDLKRWNVGLIAIDEAHCISEWGHDFRPEYRQLSTLRDHFPGVPLMALTATATDRVRDDIVRQLRLNDPEIYVASFNRPNLTYRVAPKIKAYDQVFEFIRKRRDESGIVYCFSRKATESVAEKLREDGIKALPYHAGLTPTERARHQELFLRDEVRVVTATIAFGMGINKPNVRYVVHHDLPKNVEGYYQETGRAGRDGLPSECLLLFSTGDAVKQRTFIDEKPNPKEQQIARDQLQRMIHYSETHKCRRAFLLSYFGEEWPDESCGGCDNCQAPRESYDGTIAAQKLLSCVVRIRQKTGPDYGFGLNHLVEVHTGAETDQVRKWRHNELSTYGIGKDIKRADWQNIARQLIRLGFLRQTSEKFPKIEITQAGLDTLTQRNKVMLTKTTEPKPEKVQRTGEIPCDELLFYRLRTLCHKIAHERDVPAYVIFSDVALRQMANKYPVTLEDFSRISGVGQRKLDEFAEPFTAEIAAYLKTNPRQIFADSLTPVDSRPSATRTRINDTARETLNKFCSGMTPEEIAAERMLVPGTIYGHLAMAVECGEALQMEQFFTAQDQALINDALNKCSGNVRTARELLGGKYEQSQFRLYLALRTKARG